MIQANNLIVIEVPANGEDTQLGNGNGVFVFYDTKPISTAKRYQLPSGNDYKIICLYSKATDEAIAEVLECAGLPPETPIQDLLRHIGLSHSDNDLLFMKSTPTN